MARNPAIDEQRLTEAGLSIVGDLGQGAQLGELRRTPSISPVPYEGRGELLSNRRNVLALTEQKEITKALQGLFSGIQENIPYDIRPTGSTAAQHAQVLIRPELPYEFSRLTPVIAGDPKATAELYQDAQKVIKSLGSSGKYPYTSKEVQALGKQIGHVIPNLRQVVQLGLKGGTTVNAPTVELGMKTALILLSGAIVPETADMSVMGRWMRRGGETGTLARSNEALRRTIGDILSGSRQHPGRLFGLGGPRAAEAVLTFRDVVGPLAGLRRGRLEGYPLTPDLLSLMQDAPTRVPGSVKKNLMAVESYEEGGRLSESARALSPEARAKQIESYIRQRIGPDDLEIFNKYVGDTKDPRKRIMKIIEALGAQEFRGRYEGLVPEARNILLEKATARVRPSLQRMTAAAGVSGAIEGVSPAEVEKIAERVMKRGKIPGNKLGMVMLLGTLLASGMAAMGMSREEAA